MLSPLQPTVVFDTYWRFAAERQRVYYSRLRQTSPPWTADPIIRSYKFTNAYRAADRVSQYLIRHVIYQDDIPVTPEDLFFRILLFKLFNRIETWKLLEAKLGPVTYSTYSFDSYDHVLTSAMADGQPIYSAAYVMPSGGTLGHDRKHRNHLTLLERMMRDSVCARLGRMKSMRDAFDLLRSYPTIGNFLAYQYITDINYSELTDFGESEFVMPGPGAIDGIRKAFARDNLEWTDADIIRSVSERQNEYFQSADLEFNDLFGRPLQYIDCQNLFCEVDKYARVAHPKYEGKSGRKRIKQRFTETGSLPQPWFPPKWGLNDRVEERLKENTDRWN